MKERGSNFKFHGRNRSGLLRMSVSERRFLVDGMYCPERLSDGDCVFRIPASGVASRRSQQAHGGVAAR